MVRRYSWLGLCKSGTGTRRRVCGDLGLGDARSRRGTWGHQVWDAGTCGTGTRGRQIQGRRGRRGRGMWTIVAKVGGKCDIKSLWWSQLWSQPTLPSLGFLHACLRSEDSARTHALKKVTPLSWTRSFRLDNSLRRNHLHAQPSNLRRNCM